MTLPPKLKTKYLARFDELIQEGKDIENNLTTSPLVFLTPPYQRFIRLKINCISLFDQVLPSGSSQRHIIEQLKQPEEASKIEFVYRNIFSRCLSYLQAIKSDFQENLFEDMSLQIEAEIAADYMGQAEQLLAEGQTGQYDHVPAAVLEKGLRTLCSNQTPPLPLVDGNGNHLMMNRLIDDLKRAGAFNELKAKHLRAWVDIRNAAAHGKFSEFNRSDVETMISGINNFLADYLS
jgi:hypothetical protein